jgi:hypothetical protein
MPVGYDSELTLRQGISAFCEVDLVFRLEATLAWSSMRILEQAWGSAQSQALAWASITREAQLGVAKCTQRGRFAAQVDS